MKNIFKILFILLFTIHYLEAKADTPNPNKGDEPRPTDSISDIKSNIIILKLITTPSNTINNNGSLKKAGKVARTSYSHSIIDTLLYQKRGI